MKAQLIGLTFAFSTFGLGCDTPGDSDPLDTAGGTITSSPSGTTDGTSGSTSTTCYDGTGVRAALDPIPGPSVAAKFSAWKAAVARYEREAAAFSAESQAHAAAFQAAVGDVPGRSCESDDDCRTPDPAFTGACHIYYNIGQCEVLDPNPLPTGPSAPPAPDLACADFTCASGYQCEEEASTGGIACIQARCSGGSGGGHGGNHRGSGD